MVLEAKPRPKLVPPGIDKKEDKSKIRNKNKDRSSLKKRPKQVPAVQDKKEDNNELKDESKESNK